jgi:hypothetical protein
MIHPEEGTNTSPENVGFLPRMTLGNNPETFIQNVQLSVYRPG